LKIKRNRIIGGFALIDVREDEMAYCSILLTKGNLVLITPSQSVHQRENVQQNIANDMNS
jgi:hypothetical protein